MKKTILLIAAVSAALVLFSAPASAGHRHSKSCGHNYGYGGYYGGGYNRGYQNYGYRGYYNRGYNNYGYGGYYGQQNYGYGGYGYNYGPNYGGYYGGGYSQYSYQPSYWHNHFLGGRSTRCHFYNGYHHYSRPYYRPRTSFHLGISIFR